MTVYDPPVATYIPLQTITLGSAASSVTFADIPATYRDLVLVANGTTVASNVYVVLQLNADDASNYSNVFMVGFGSTTESIASTDTSIKRSGMGDSQSTVIWQLVDYSATDKHKTVLSRWGANSSTNVAAAAGRWANTSAINSVKVYPESTTFTSGSTFSLYGIEA